MILYSLPISNYCGKVLHALRFKDWNARSYLLREATDPRNTKTGSFRDHPGAGSRRRHLSESEVINEYLNEVFPEPNLLPGSAEQRQRSACFAGCMTLKLEPIVRSLFPAMSPEKEMPKWWKSGWRKWSNPWNDCVG